MTIKDPLRTRKLVEEYGTRFEIPEDIIATALNTYDKVKGLKTSYGDETFALGLLNFAFVENGLTNGISFRRLKLKMEASENGVELDKVYHDVSHELHMQRAARAPRIPLAGALREYLHS